MINVLGPAFRLSPAALGIKLKFAQNCKSHTLNSTLQLTFLALFKNTSRELLLYFRTTKLSYFEMIWHTSTQDIICRRNNYQLCLAGVPCKPLPLLTILKFPHHPVLDCYPRPHKDCLFISITNLWGNLSDRHCCCVVLMPQILRQPAPLELAHIFLFRLPSKYFTVFAKPDPKTVRCPK